MLAKTSPSCDNVVFKLRSTQRSGQNSLNIFPVDRPCFVLLVVMSSGVALLPYVGDRCVGLGVVGCCGWSAKWTCLSLLDG